eukprot:jgi/Galph1/2208/GphlegSOOS_G896.1
MSGLPTTVDFYCLRCLDIENGTALRKQLREEHLKWVEKINCVPLGGPLVNRDGVIKGSLILSNLLNLEQVENCFKEDPYRKGNLFARVDITVFKRVKDFPVHWPSSLFVVYCLDDPSREHIRLEERPKHRSWWQAESRVVTVGPMASTKDPNKLVLLLILFSFHCLANFCSQVGSLFFVIGEDIEEVKQWANNDPYAKAGLFMEVSVYEWKRVIENGRLVGGLP